ncbi:DUF1780 domain-containing protein [Sinorhizobium fredii]|uniref:DUF1780 domain-containing protein n=1 Tax=Rhizobium fredii TaxID=380 RepID=UPI0035166848
MARSDREFLDRIRSATAAARRFFSHEGADERERTMVAGFLTVLGIDYSADDIIKAGPEPIDVHFRDAKFQTTEILDDDRKRDKEIRERGGRAARAQRAGDLLEPVNLTGSAISAGELVERVRSCADAKRLHYAGQVARIDLLVYVNLRGRFVRDDTSFHAFSETEAGGWRSISVVMEGFAIVLWAAHDAPAFLCAVIGKPMFRRTLESNFPDLSATPERR